MHHRQRAIALLAIMLIIAAGTAACGRAGRTTATPTPPAPATSGDAGVVSAEAVVLPWQQSDLSFKSSGRIEAILVEVGDQVTEGQELARLERRDLELAVKDAQSRLQAAEAQLQKAKVGPRAEEIGVAEAAVAIAQAYADAAEAGVEVAEGRVTSAQAAVSSAQARLNQVRSGATSEELNGAAAAVEQAAAAVKQAQAAYDKIKGQPDVGLMPQALQLEQATSAYSRALASYQNLSNGATPAQVNVYQQAVKQAQADVPLAQSQVAQARAQADAARSQLVQAQAQLGLLKAGSRSEDVAAVEAAAGQARVAVDRAQNALADAILEAPFAGTVAAISANEGQMASPQGVVVAIGDLSRLKVETTDLGEADVNLVQIGQPVKISLDGVPGRTFTGKVSRISPVATKDRGDQVYAVIVDLDAGLEAGLRWGMTASVDIQVR